MLLHTAVRAAQWLHTDDITDTTPDAGLIGADGQAKAKSIVALVLWGGIALMFVYLIVAFVMFAGARQNNPQKVEAAKRQVWFAIGGLVLFGGAQFITKTAMNLL